MIRLIAVYSRKNQTLLENTRFQNYLRQNPVDVRSWYHFGLRPYVTVIGLHLFKRLFTVTVLLCLKEMVPSEAGGPQYRLSLFYT